MIVGKPFELVVEVARGSHITENLILANDAMPAKHLPLLEVEKYRFPGDDSRIPRASRDHV